MTKIKSADPYQIFFPIGIAYSVVGTGLWIAHALGTAPYANVFHANVMVVGFLFTFAIGFLMTAIPRFTGGPAATRTEVRTVVALNLVFLPVGLLAPQWVHAVSLAIIASQAYFALTRFLKRSFSPPSFFAFLPVGFLLGILGSIALLVTDLQISSAFFSVGKHALYQGMMLSFVMGIGGKLISALLGWEVPPLVILEGTPKQKEKFHQHPQFAVTLALAFFFSFVIDAWQRPEAAQFAAILRAVIATTIGITKWHIFKKPKQKSKLAHWLWIACISLVVGMWVYALVPQWGVHALHLQLVAGVGLITLLVASRVSLAHGGYPLSFEEKSTIYRWIAMFAIVAALTRFLAPMIGNYQRHLGYAALMWICATGLWSKYFLRKIIERFVPAKRQSKQNAPTC